MCSDNRVYTVYMHVAPNGKKYIGITGSQLKKRFGHKGNAYKKQVFGRAIQKYGWDNILHIIFAENLLRDEAKQMEIELITKYNTTNPKFGYNQSEGGDIVSEKQKEKISNSVKKLWENEEYRKRCENKVVSELSRKRMSEAHKGKKHTKEHIEKIRLGNFGKKYSKETRQLISDIVKQQHKKEKELGIKRNIPNWGDGSSSRGSKWYNNGIINVRRKDGCPNGFVPGKLMHNS